MRKFKLINSKGDTFDLTRKDAFFHSPDGLGFEETIEFSSVGNQFCETDRKDAQATITGEMVFGGYAEYSEFVSFITNEMTMYYCPYGTTWYQREGILQKIGKSEISSDSKRLICAIDFVCTSLWHSDVSFQKAAISSGSGKTYPYTYSYIYVETAAGDVEITNASSVDSPCKIHILGPCTNPRWSLIQGGEVIMDGKVNITLLEGKKLVVNSDSLDTEITEYTTNNSFVADRYQLSDFSTARFLMIPPGVSIIRFSHEGSGEISAYIEVKQIAKTV